MELSVRFFALYRERAGCRQAAVRVSDDATVEDLLAAVREMFPRLAPPEVKIVVAVNEEYAEPDRALRPGDEICLIPPVSGGLAQPGQAKYPDSITRTGKCHE